MPFATCLVKRGKPRLASLYFCAEHADDCFVASTNFPFGQHLGSIQNLCPQTLQHILVRHPQQIFLVAGAWPEISGSLYSQVWRIMDAVLRREQKTVWTLGGFSASNAKCFHKNFGLGTMFGLNSAQACATACQSWWRTSFQPYWPVKLMCFDYCVVPITIIYL